jgi:predicted Zn-dependent protease
MAKRFGVDLKVTRLLLEIGVMAVWIKRVEDGERIIQCIKAFRDDVPHPSTAYAAGLIYQGHTQAAIKELEGALQRFPNHQLGKSLLALAYADEGRRGWQELCKQVIDDGRDEWAIELARETLGYDYGLAKAAAARQSTTVRPVFA